MYVYGTYKVQYHNRISEAANSQAIGRFIDRIQCYTAPTRHPISKDTP